MRLSVWCAAILCLAAGSPTAGAQSQASPDELAVQAVAEYDVASMSFSDWLFILSRRDASAANRIAADKVWAHIMALQGKALLKIPAKVLSASKGTLDVAITDKAQRDGISEMHVALKSALTDPVEVGTQVDVTGHLTGYSTNPLRLMMDNAGVAR